MKLHPKNLLVSICLLLLGLVLVTQMCSCSEVEKEIPTNQGVIVYEVSFPFDQDNPYINIFPKEMTFTFKENKIKAKLASFAEVVCSEFIIDNSEKRFEQYFKVFDEKYHMELDEKGVAEMLKHLPNLELRNTAEIDSVAGLICAKSLASFIDRSAQPIILYHTHKIQLDEPNWYNQFSDLKDVLLAYEIEQFGKRMRLEAKEIRYEAVSDSDFVSPSGYSTVSFDEMHGKIEGLVAQFDQE